MFSSSAACVRYCFTFNNYTDDDIALVKAFAEEHTRYLIFGKEIAPTTGTPHLQGFFILKKKNRMTWLVKRIPRCSFLTSKGAPKQAADYCRKAGDVWEHGKITVSGQRNDLEAVAQRITQGASLSDIAHENPVAIIKYSRGLSVLQSILSGARETSHVRGIWLHGPPGAGKSYLVRKVLDYPLFVKQQNKWWDGYAGESHVLMDDFDMAGACLGHYIKIWADKYVVRSAEIKGSTINLNHRFLFVTSNYTIEQIWPADVILQLAILRRFHVIGCYAHTRDSDLRKLQDYMFGCYDNECNE